MAFSSDQPLDRSTSSSLIRRAQQREPESWQRLVDLYGPLVFYWCRRKGQLSGPEAADVFQEIFAAVSHSLERFSHEGPQYTFRGWLWTISRNKIRDHYRWLQQQPQAIGGRLSAGLAPTGSAIDGLPPGTLSDLRIERDLRLQIPLDP